MASVVQIFVEDFSPTVIYSPIADTFSSPDLSAGWNPNWDDPGFSSATLGATGSGNSSHITSRNGSGFEIQWKGTGIQLFGTADHSTYNITLDGQSANATPNATSNSLFDVEHLADAEHTLTCVVQMDGTAQALFKFDKAIISAPPLPSNFSTSNFVTQALSDKAVSLSGPWSFVNDSSSHQSTTTGDTAKMQFQGTAFLLLGTTSPDAGSYSVTLDNVTSSYSARSSFSQPDSLLFFASGLDATKVHDFEINNTGGATLVLPVGGAKVYALNATGAVNASSSPSSSSTSSLAAASHPGLPSGTIAALALAGVLIFFIVCSALLYFLLYRPYKRRQLLQQQQHRSPKEEEADVDGGSFLVVDIAPEAVGAKMFYDHASLAGPSRDRTSKRSGFARWREEVEGSRFGSWGRNTLGIAFRHSDSTGRRGTTSGTSNDYELGAASDGYKSTSSSSNSGYSGSRKGKERAGGSSRWPRTARRQKSLSPQIMLDLPLEPVPPRSRSHSNPPSNAPSDAPSNVPSQFDASVISSLSYMSSPSINPMTIPSEPSSPPAPSRPSPYPNTHSRANSNNVLLLHTDAPPPLEPEEGYRPSVTAPPVHIPTPPPSDPPRQDDRGSVRDYDATDDGRSILGDGTARIALRSLSPRTSEAEERRERSKRRAKKMRSKERQQQMSSPLAHSSVEASELDLAENPAPTEQLPELRATSPFRVEFNSGDPRNSQQSRVRFESDPGPQGDTKGGQTTISKVDQASKGPFRLTPLGAGPPDLRDTSFLDFTSSSEGSVLTRDLSSSRSFSSLGPKSAWSGPQSHWSIGATSSNVASIVPPPQPRSRWSATTAPSSEAHHDQSNGSSDSSNFPFPTQLPPSPHHPEGTFVPPPIPSSLLGPTHLDIPAAPSSTRSSLNAHPADLMSENLTSPTDSVPMSVSDIHFTHSSSEGNTGNNSRTSHNGLPAHPPLPPIPGSSAEENAPYIVQRTVGMHTPSPSIGTTMLGSATPTAVRFNATPSPGATSRPSPGSSAGRGS